MLRIRYSKLTFCARACAIAASLGMLALSAGVTAAAVPAVTALSAGAARPIIGSTAFAEHRYRIVGKTK